MIITLMELVVVEAWPTGAPSDACDNLTPQHGFNTQTSVLPYSVDLSEFNGTTYTPGQTYTSKQCKPFKVFHQVLLCALHMYSNHGRWGY